jgi:MOSC domain-containing protein YiiM
MNAYIFQINTSPGGVPKLGLHQAEVTELGLAGDQHRSESHGGPERAVCLFSLERILALQAEGHPIFPGSIGENVTVSGLDWSQVVPGSRLRLGGEVLVEVTRYTSPCNNIAGSFVDDGYERVSQTRHPGWSRVYARVIQPGSICVSDHVELL